MKHQIYKVLLIIILISGCAGIKVAQEFNGLQSFKGVKWGMSRDKVQVVTDRDLKKSDNLKYYMGDIMYGMPCKVTYEFGVKDRLRSISVDFETTNPDAEHDYVIKNVSQVFGDPKKNSKTGGVVWHSPDTAVVLLISGGEEKTMNLTFVNKEKQ